MRYQKNRLRSFELERLETRNVLSGIGFAEQATRELGSVEAVADVDGDGDLDFVSNVAWRENVEGGLGQTIEFDFSTEPNSSAATRAFDFDGDTDVDIITTGWNAELRVDEVRLYENLDGQGRFGAKRVVAALDRSAGQLFLQDLDGDRDPDILIADCARRRCSFRWMQNTQGVFIDAGEIASGLESGHLLPVEFDGDGDIDLFHIDTNGFTTLLENLNDGTYEKRIDPLPSSYWLTQLRSETSDTSAFLSITDGWFQTLDRDSNFLGRNLFRIPSEITGPPNSAIAADVDQDGDNDLVILEIQSPIDQTGEPFGSLVWFERLEDGWSSRNELFTFRRHAYSVPHVVDVNDDGFLDIVFERSTFLFNREQQQYETGRPMSDAIADSVVAAIDIDGDGDLDLLSSSQDTGCRYGEASCGRSIFLRENRGDGVGLNGARKTLVRVEWDASQGDDDFVDSQSISAADVDGDGDLDLLYSVVRRNRYASRVTWLENQDGHVNFSAERSLDISQRLLGVHDLDGDGTRELVTANASEIFVWSAGTDGTLLSAESSIVISDDGIHFGVSPVDWDNDGDLDLMAVRNKSGNAIELVLFEQNSPLSFAEPRVVLTRQGAYDRTSTQRPQGTLFSVQDFDGDGDLDILDSHLRWRDTFLENQADQGLADTWQERTLNHDAFGATDVDGDGDVDYFAREDGSSAVYLNDGRNEFTKHAAPLSIFLLADVDNDGDTDIISNGATWYENRPLGDANDDGVFNSSDIVLVMQAGRLEDDVPANGTFGTGDWNSDGEVTTADLVYAFANGIYEG